MQNLERVPGDSLERLRTDALSGSLSRRALLKRAAVLGMSLPAISALLAACGDDDDDDTDDAAPVAPDDDDADEPEPDDDEAPDEPDDEDDEPDDVVSGGTINFGLLRDPIAFDPHINYGASSSTLQGNLYDTLVGWDDDGNIMPELAESWEIAEDRIYTFHLQQGVTFHNGNSFTAADVVHTFDRILDEETGASRRTELSTMESYQAVDDNTVEVVLSEPYASLLAVLGGPESYIVNQEFSETGADYTNTVNGTGAFMLDDYEPDVRYVLVRNEDYWQSGLPRADRLVQMPIPDDTARINALRTGEINFVEYVPWQNMQELDDDPGFTLYQGFDLFNVVRLNPQRPPLDNPLVRQALNFAIDRQAIIDVAFGGQGIPITVALLQPGTPWYNEELDGHWSYDPDRAVALLEEAGFAPGDISLSFAAATISVHMDTAQVVAQQLQQLGLSVEITQQEVPTLTERRTTGDYQMMQDGLSSRPDPDMVYTNFFGIGGSGYAAGVDYENEELEALLDQGRTTVEFEARKDIYRQFEEILVEEAPWIFIMWRPQAEASAANVRGYVRNPTLGLNTPRYMKHLWIEE
jgi:peptide/nickel transport system substrate-binding protein